MTEIHTQMVTLTVVSPELSPEVAECVVRVYEIKL